MRIENKYGFSRRYIWDILHTEQTLRSYPRLKEEGTACQDEYNLNFVNRLYAT